MPEKVKLIRFTLIFGIPRTKLFIFSLDTSFTTFCYTPPHFTIPDLAFPFPYPDLCFETSTAGAFIDTLQRHYSASCKTQEIPIYQVVELLCDAASPTSTLQVTELGGYILIQGIRIPQTYCSVTANVWVSFSCSHP